MSVENCLVKAIYSFKGKNNDELCFKKGDIITVTQKEEGGWWEGTLGETTGWFPSNYVTEYKDTSGSLTTSPIRAASEIQAFRNVVLKDIVDSEKAHVAEMQGLVSNFLHPLERSDMLAKDEFKQLTGNINEVLQVHEQFLSLLEECAMKTGPDQRVGGLFLQWAPRIKTVHQTYCAGHPKAVCILDKYKENLNTWMESAGAVCPGVLVLTAGLSKPFRRLGKYPAMLQELARHVHEAHPDRGDTHRASVVYKDIASACAALRRQKELELQVVTGEVRGWPGGELTSLGDVLHMGSVAVGPSHQDRYLVLFPSALLLLSVSKRVSAFVYEGCLPLTGITVCKLDDTETRKNAFEISGPMIDTIVAVCQTRAEADNWVSLLQKHSNSSPSHEPSQPQSLPHMALSDSSNELSSGLTSHKRSHSFNNHQSFTQHTQQTQKHKSKNQSARWLLNSCDSLNQSINQPKSKIPIGKKFSSIDFTDAAEAGYNSKGWSITCLRPAPPLRPQSFAAGSDDNIGQTHPYAPHTRKYNSYEEDALILKVIEAYCTSARCRNAVSSECDDENISIEALVRSPSLPIHSTSNHGSPSLWTIVMRLQNEIKTLKLDVKNLQLQLNDEKQDRTLAMAALQSRNIFKDAKEKCDDENLSIEALVRSPSLPIHSTSNHGSPSLWTIVMRLQNEIKTLKLDVKNLQLQLNDEKQDRTLAMAALQSRNILKDAKEKCDDENLPIEALVRSPSLPIHSTSNHRSLSLWTIVMRLLNEIKTLKLDVKNLQLQLNDEKQDRTLAMAALQSRNIFKDAKESKC